MRRLEIRVVPEEGYEKEYVVNDVWNALLSSNPNAHILLKEGDVTINVVTHEKLYEGLEIPRGKGKRLTRKTED